MQNFVFQLRAVRLAVVKKKSADKNLSALFLLLPAQRKLLNYNAITQKSAACW